MKNKITYINLFTNNFRSINVIKLVSKKYRIKNIFLAKKNLNLRLVNFLEKKKIKFKIIDRIDNPQILKTIKEKEIVNIVCGLINHIKALGFELEFKKAVKITAYLVAYLIYILIFCI